jgi:hypothetical protein
MTQVQGDLNTEVITAWLAEKASDNAKERSDNAREKLAQAIESFVREGGYSLARAREAREILERELTRLEIFEAANEAANEAAKQAAQAKLAELGWKGPIPEQWR